MSNSVRLLIIVTVAAASASFAAATVLFPPRNAIDGPVGMGYWIVLTLVASALPVRLPQGTFASGTNHFIRKCRWVFFEGRQAVRVLKSILLRILSIPEETLEEYRNAPAIRKSWEKAQKTFPRS